MGALRGNLTFARFYVKGDVPDDLIGQSLKRIRANAFRPLAPEDEANEGFGWANLEDPFDTELDHEKVSFNEYLGLGLRLDRWAIPGPMLKSQLKEAEQALLAKRGIEQLGRKAKADLKAVVVRKLRKQLVPTMRSFDVVWNLHSNVVYLHSQSPRAAGLLDELFEKTFELGLVPESPVTAMDRRGLHPEQDRKLQHLEPTSLARGDVLAAQRRLLEEEVG